jgi:hypothetical protein
MLRVEVCLDMTTSARAGRLLIPVLLVFVLLAGCLVKKDSPAPGCIEYWGLAPMGGCFGKTAIVDLQVEPEMECLQVSVNNCNGGILEVSNSCAEILFLSRITIHPGETNVGLDLARENDEYFFQRADSNFSEYIPAEDEPVEILGMMGAVEVRITFTKTSELC